MDAFRSLLLPAREEGATVQALRLRALIVSNVCSARSVVQQGLRPIIDTGS